MKKATKQSKPATKATALRPASMLGSRDAAPQAEGMNVALAEIEEQKAKNLAARQLPQTRK